MTGLHQTQDKPSTAIPKKSPLGFERAEDLSSYTVPKDQILDFLGICVPGTFLNGPCCSMTGASNTGQRRTRPHSILDEVLDGPSLPYPEDEILHLVEIQEKPCS